MANPAIVLPLLYLPPPSEAYAVTATISGQDFHLIIDTGSPDTWVAQDGYTRLREGSSDEEGSSDVESSEDNSTTQSGRANNPCNLGNLLDPNVANFSPIEDAEFQFGYESTEKAQGLIGKVPVFSLGAHDFKNVLLEVANALFWNGKSVESGVLGLAGPASQVTNIAGNRMDDPNAQSKYDSFTTEIFKEHLVARPGVFTLALGRANATSAIAFFGRAAEIFTQFNIHADPNLRVSTVVDLKGHAMVGEWLIKPTLYTFISISTQTTMAQNGVTALVDSGDELIRLERNFADIFHKLWTPQLTSLEEDDHNRIKVPNDATPPSLVITINGVNFQVESQDLKLTLEDGTCCSAVQSINDDSHQVLGIPFLKNVIAEFHIESKEMVFYQRRYQ